MKKPIHTSGKRKMAVARVTLKEGTGKVTVNKKSLDQVEPEMARMKLSEPLLLANQFADKVDIKISVKGGGFMSQAEACRLAVARALSRYQTKLKEVFMEYDRQLLVADVRRRESSKPNSQGKARSKRQKSYR
jgi:small subunit ribosomal protein S9